MDVTRKLRTTAAIKTGDIHIREDRSFNVKSTLVLGGGRGFEPKLNYFRLFADIDF